MLVTAIVLQSVGSSSCSETFFFLFIIADTNMLRQRPGGLPSIAVPEGTSKFGDEPSGWNLWLRRQILRRPRREVLGCYLLLLLIMMTVVARMVCPCLVVGDEFDPARTVVYYLGEPRYPNNSKDNIEACVRHISEPPSSRMAVIVLGANRPDYFQKVLDSLSNQTQQGFDTFLFLDRIENSPQHLEVIRVAQEFRANSGGVYVSKRNVGVARLTLFAIETVLDPNHARAAAVFDKTSGNNNYNDKYDRFLVLEDDHLIGHSYIEAIGMLLTASEGMPDVAVVNGNYIDTPHHGQLLSGSGRNPMLMVKRDEDCQFQLAPLDSSMIEISAHNVWAWATTRQKWNIIRETFHQALDESGMVHYDTDITAITSTTTPLTSYQKRDRKRIRLVMERICPNTGILRWQGQDWLRACVFHSLGLKYKLQPTQRLMSYVGAAGGLHMNADKFSKSGFDPVTPTQLTRNLAEYPRSLCQHTCVLERLT
jgi:hypothetical protein